MGTSIISNVKKVPKDKSNGIIFGTHDGFITDGEIYYSGGKLWLAKKVTTNGVESIEAKEIIDIDSLSAKLNRRYLNYDLFPFESKDNWFRYQGICQPAFIGYNYKIVQLKIGIMPTIALNGTTNSVLDELSRMSSPMVVVDGPAISNLFTKTFTDIGYPANTSLGLYFDGYTTTQRNIELRLNGNVLLKIKTEDFQITSDSGVPLNKHYIAEVIVEPYFGETIYQINNNE